MDYSPASSTASSSSSSSSIHPGSLVDASLHSPALLDLIEVKITKEVIDYTVDVVATTVDFAMGRVPRTHGWAGQKHARQFLFKPHKRPELAPFTTFVTNVLTRGEVTMPTLLGALAYIDRARPHLHIALEEWALERVFLGAVMAASKYLNDSTLKNVHWAMCTGCFGKRDVGRIEREFLDVLDFELGISEADVLAHYEGLLEATQPRASLASRILHPRHHLKNHHRSHLSGSRLTHASTIHQHEHPLQTRQHACPDLAPSSPNSSDGSLSPQTPPSVAHSSSTHPLAPPPAKTRQRHHHSRSQDGSIDMGALLDSFPLPLPMKIGQDSHPLARIPVPTPMAVDA